MNEVLDQAYKLRARIRQFAEKQRIEADLIGIFKPPELTPGEEFLEVCEKIVKIEEEKARCG